MNCLVLEDQQILLDLLGSILASFNEISAVFKADSIEAANNICDDHKLDLAILDIYLPDGHCLDLAQHLVSQHQNIKIIILSGAAQEFVCPKSLKEAIYGIILATHGTCFYRRTTKIIKGKFGMVMMNCSFIQEGF